MCCDVMCTQHHIKVTMCCNVICTQHHINVTMCCNVMCTQHQIPEDVYIEQINYYNYLNSFECCCYCLLCIQDTTDHSITITWPVTWLGL